MEHPFYKKVSWQINQDKCILSFPSWCFTWPSCELLVGNLDVSVKEIIYVTAVQDGQRQWGLLFICGPSRKSGGHKALPGNFEYFLLWLDVILSVHVEWMCSHVLEIKIQMWARPQLSAFQRQPGSGARQACRHIISAQCRECSDGVDAYHVSVMLKIWRECAHAQQTTKQQQTANKQQHTEI